MNFKSFKCFECGENYEAPEFSKGMYCPDCLKKPKTNKSFDEVVELLMKRDPHKRNYEYWELMVEKILHR